MAQVERCMADLDAILEEHCKRLLQVTNTCDALQFSRRPAK